MLFLRRQKNEGEEIMLVAMSEDDWKVIDYLYHSGIVFGAYLLYNFKDDKNKSTDLAKFMIKNFPLAFGILRVNVVKNYVPKAKG